MKVASAVYCWGTLLSVGACFVAALGPPAAGAAGIVIALSGFNR
jgi:hypothetical protein